MKSCLVIGAFTMFATLPCFASPNEGAPAYSDEEIYQSLPIESEVLISQSHGERIYQRSDADYVCTAHTRFVPRGVPGVEYACQEAKMPTHGPIAP